MTIAAAEAAAKLRYGKTYGRNQSGDASKNGQKIESYINELPVVFNDEIDLIRQLNELGSEINTKVIELETLLFLYNQLYPQSYTNRKRQEYVIQKLNKKNNTADDRLNNLMDLIKNSQQKLNRMTQYYNERYLPTMNKRKNKSK